MDQFVVLTTDYSAGIDYNDTIKKKGEKENDS